MRRHISPLHTLHHTQPPQVVFDYTGYNESASPIDSSYRQGRPAETRLGINGLIPGAACGGAQRSSFAGGA